MTNNNNNEKELVKKDSLIWIYNPFYLFLGLTPLQVEFEYSITLLPTMFKMNFEQELTNSVEKKVNRLKKLYDDSFSLGFGALRGNLPILNLTYLFSFYIATDPDLRRRFYKNFLGEKIPAFFQFLLNSVRLGDLDENYSVSKIIIDPAFDERIWVLNRFLVSSIDPNSIEENFDSVIKWFDLIELLFEDQNLYFAYFVELEKTPLVSDQKLTLTGFNQKNTKFLNNSNLNHRSVLEMVWFHLKAILNIRVDNYAILETMWFHLKAMGNTPQENSKFKNLLVLNKAVNANLVSSKDFLLKRSWKFQGKLLPVFYENQKGDEKVSTAEEYKLGSELFDFITNCHPKDLNLL